MTLFQKVAPAEISDLSQEDFIFFRELIFDLAGIHLGEKKRDLVVTRIRSHLQKRGFHSFSEYRDLLENKPAGHPDIQEFVNLLTTNKTEFFREPRHFDFLVQSAIPKWVKEGKKTINVWSCASSTGEEPYTLSMVLRRHLPETLPYRILATDIDTQVLSRAQNGVYSLAKLNEIPETYRDGNLKMGTGKAEGWFKIADPIRDPISFQKHNLIEASYLGDEVFDVIFCRNVLIYFSPETIRTLLSKLHRSLKPGGLLMIGHSESIQGCRLFETLQPAIFRKS